MQSIKKIIFIIIGLVALVLGSIGVILPVLPTTPFLLLASFCFVRGSDRFDSWFKSSMIYKNYLEDFCENRSMTLKQKFSISLFADIMIAFPIVILDNIYVRIFLIFVVIYKYYYFIFRINTQEP